MNASFPGRWTRDLLAGDPPPRALVGGKAASIARMAAMGLPVPPAFAVTTAACNAFLETGALPDGLADELGAGVAWLETRTGGRFGGEPVPLLVSVRSGAPVSMPGMMDTVLNLGMNDTSMTALAAQSGDLRFAKDCYRRFLALYAGIVLKLPDPDFDPQGEPAEWRAQIEARAPGHPPQDPQEQLLAAVQAVFTSWTSRRAKRYRKHHGIPEDLGTAVTVQAMVFGNLGDNSGTGVLFTRNPLTGERAPYGEYLPRAQGEDVVSGRYTPRRIDQLAALLPHIHGELMAAADRLESANRDIQDIEFTVHQGDLYLLQARTAKRAPAAAVRIAVAMHDEGLISEAEALARVTPEQLRRLLGPRLAAGAAEAAAVVAHGEGASPGVAYGIVVTDSDQAERRAAAGEAVILARATTSPDDVHGMLAARAVITERGGATSHAAVVGRSLGLPCVVGCAEGSVTTLAGQTVTVDGSTGRVYAGALDVVVPDEGADADLARLLQWARAASPLAVYRPGEAPDGDILDLDRVPGGETPEQLGALLRGAQAARGGAIAGDAGVAAALAAGLHFIVADPVLPPLLAAIARNRTDKESK